MTALALELSQPTAEVSDSEQFAVDYFAVPELAVPKHLGEAPIVLKANQTILFEMMYAASVEQGADAPLSGYTGITPHNHDTQKGLIREWCERAGWQEDILEGALKMFHDNWKRRTGYQDGDPVEVIVH